MEYYDWRNAVFNQPIRDLVDADLDIPGHLVAPLSMDHLCFNFWDRLSFFPTSEDGPRATHAGLDVIESALALPNDNIIVASVETLCFWTFACKDIGIDRPASVLRNWLANPTIKNISVFIVYKQMIDSSLTMTVLGHFQSKTIAAKSSRAESSET